MINASTTNRTALGRMVVNTKGGQVSTISLWCASVNRQDLALRAVKSNGIECKAINYYWNGKKITF